MFLLPQGALHEESQALQALSWGTVLREATPIFVLAVAL